jgi:hypothetical protein
MKKAAGFNRQPFSLLVVFQEAITKTKFKFP